MKEGDESGALVRMRRGGAYHQDLGGEKILEKIVIRTDRRAPDTHLLPLLELLNRFFPECEIHIVGKTPSAEHRDPKQRPRSGL